MSTIVLAKDVADLGKVIRERRRQLRLDQNQLADLTSVSRRFISALESGKATVRLDKLLVVLEALGLEIHLAVRGEKPRP
jgi:y4mF family transcriptional regulator